MQWHCDQSLRHHIFNPIRFQYLCLICKIPWKVKITHTAGDLLDSDCLLEDIQHPVLRRYCTAPVTSKVGMKVCLVINVSLTPHGRQNNCSIHSQCFVQIMSWSKPEFAGRKQNFLTTAASCLNHTRFSGSDQPDGSYIKWGLLITISTYKCKQERSDLHLVNEDTICQQYHRDTDTKREISNASLMISAKASGYRQSIKKHSDFTDWVPLQDWSENPAHKCLAPLNTVIFQSEHSEGSH